MAAFSVTEVCVLQHAAVEWCVQATGRAPTWLFLVPQHGSPALVRVGDDGLPDTDWVRRRAADVGAVGAVLSGEFWLGAVSIPAAQRRISHWLMCRSPLTWIRPTGGRRL